MLNGQAPLNRLPAQVKAGQQLEQILLLTANFHVQIFADR